jgi:predicted DNA-binding transcriptional regulator AlpA
MLVNDKYVAKILGIAPATLAIWRCTKRYQLPYVKVGRLIRYKESDVEAFIQSRIQNGEEE